MGVKPGYKQTEVGVIPQEPENKPGAASVAPDFFRACRLVF